MRQRNMSDTSNSRDRAARGSSDALVLRMLNEAASSPPPIGLFDPIGSDLPRMPLPSAFIPSGPASNPQLGGADALVQRLLDDAVNKRPPVGLFDATEPALLRAPTRSDLRSVFPSALASPPAPATARDGSDALVRRILDEAATNRPPMGLFDSSGFGPALAASQAATAQIGGGAITPLSTIPPIAHPPRALLAARLHPR
jgi:hypothetical protein